VLTVVRVVHAEENTPDGLRRYLIVRASGDAEG
jgi:hypothetical protein